MSMLSMATVVVAAATPTPSQTVDPRVYSDPNSISPGMLGLASMIFLCVTVYVIWRGLNKQLKRINFEEGAPRGPQRYQIPLMADPVNLPPSVDSAQAPEAVDVTPPATASS